MHEARGYLGPRSIVRNPTDRSRLSESIVADFMRSGRRVCEVSLDGSPYTLAQLYKGIWNVCRKSCWRGRVAVSRRDGRLLLRRL